MLYKDSKYRNLDLDGYACWLYGSFARDNLDKINKVTLTDYIHLCLEAVKLADTNSTSNSIYSRSWVYCNYRGGTRSYNGYKDY